MRITKVQSQHNKKRVSIFIDGDFCFSLSNELFVLSGIKEGAEITEIQISNLKRKDENERAYSYVLLQLGYGLKTEKEIRRKMASQKYSQTAQEYAIEKAKEYSFIDDKEYCLSFIRQHKSSGGWGKQKMISSLLVKGIDKETIYDCMDTEYSEDEAEKIAYELAVKKYSNIKEKYEPYKVKQKVYAYILSKGYSYDIAKNVVEKLV